VAMLHHFMREQEIFGWNWGDKHKGAYLNFGAIICPITEVLHIPSHSRFDQQVIINFTQL
jgi:hypothetical protein